MKNLPITPFGKGKRKFSEGNNIMVESIKIIIGKMWRKKRREIKLYLWIICIYFFVIFSSSGNGWGTILQ